MSKILITGGSGFLGNELAEKLKENNDVLLGSRNNKQNFLSEKKTGCDSMPMDVANLNSVNDVINYFNPDTIIHAAATKFVDWSEKFPLETIDVNIVGSANIARVAIDKNIKNVIGISTDKASPPIRNIYGLSKATMEKMFCNLNSQYKTNFMAVRYGNVAWSTGSVLQAWWKMKKNGEVIKTTGQKMRRFIFTVSEASELVLTALKNIEIYSGKILAREMKSTEISNLSKIWSKKFGDKFETISSRPGERIDEYIVGEEEVDYSEEIKIDNINHYLIQINDKSKNPINSYLSSENSERLTETEIEHILDSIPPELK